MLTFVWIGIILIAIITFVLINQKPKLKKTSNQELIASGERSLFTIQIGDIITYNTEDWFVEGRVIYDAGGYNWLEYLLVNDNEIRWLSVEQDDMIEVLWMKPNNTLDVSTTPPKKLNLEGNIYKCVDSGDARIRWEGNTRNKQSEICKYYDYENKSDDNQVLSIEIWGNEIEVMVGEKIPPRSINILPGDGQSVYN